MHQTLLKIAIAFHVRIHIVTTSNRNKHQFTPTEEVASSAPKMNEDILRPNPESTPPGCRKRWNEIDFWRK